MSQLTGPFQQRYVISLTSFPAFGNHQFGLAGTCLQSIEGGLIDWVKMGRYLLCKWCIRSPVVRITVPHSLSGRNGCFHSNFLVRYFWQNDARLILIVYTCSMRDKTHLSGPSAKWLRTWALTTVVWRIELVIPTIGNTCALKMVAGRYCEKSYRQCYEGSIL